MPRTLPTVKVRPGALLALVWMLCVTGGCTPRDPLDRIVEARTLAELQAWLDDVDTVVEPELGREITLVFHNLASTTPKFHVATTPRELHQRGNPFCQRVHGRRLRDVLIEGYESTITTLSQQNNLDADNLLRLSTAVSLDRADAFAARIDYVKSEIARRDAVIQHHRERIDQLRKP